MRCDWSSLLRWRKLAQIRCDMLWGTGVNSDTVGVIMFGHHGSLYLLVPVLWFVLPFRAANLCNTFKLVAVEATCTGMIIFDSNSSCFHRAAVWGTCPVYHSLRRSLFKKMRAYVVPCSTIRIHSLQCSDCALEILLILYRFKQDCYLHSFSPWNTHCSHHGEIGFQLGYIVT